MRLTAALASAAFALSVAPWASAQPPSYSAPPGGAGTLTIVTVPRLPGLHFALGARTFVTARDGIARIAAAPGVYPLRLLDRDVRGRDIRSSFARWSDNWFSLARTVRIHGPTELEVGFEQSALVGFEFVDRRGRTIGNDRVARLTLSSTIGSRDTFPPDRTRWLITERVTRRFYGLAQTRVQYSVERAVVGGSNVVNKTQQRFYATPGGRVRLSLLLYSARIEVHDLLFGFSIGHSLELVYPDGNRTTFRLADGRLDLSSLPRGTYGIRVHAWGYSPAVPLALSKDQDLSLRVVSYLDMLTIAVVAVALTLVLVLLRRPRLRARFRLRLRTLQPLRGLAVALDRLIATIETTRARLPHLPVEAGRPAAVSEPAVSVSSEPVAASAEPMSLEDAFVAAKLARQKAAK